MLLWYMIPKTLESSGGPASQTKEVDVPDQLSKRKLAPSYVGILDWLEIAKTEGFQCKNGQVPLFGRQRERWTVDRAWAFVKVMEDLWDTCG